MQIGTITLDGAKVGVVVLSSGEVLDPFIPDLDGYEPQGRAWPQGVPPEQTTGQAHDRHGAPVHGADHALTGETDHGSHAHPIPQGSAETRQDIVDAAHAHHLDPNLMLAAGSIESDLNPASNAHRATKYKGLYQIGPDEWRRFGNGGNIYSARDNAFAAARMFDANRTLFRKHFHRDPTDREMYMMHQQGLGFYTRGAMTNIRGNPYPGMHGPQTHASFEAGWGRELERRKAQFEALDPTLHPM